MMLRIIDKQAIWDYQSKILGDYKKNFVAKVRKYQHGK